MLAPKLQLYHLQTITASSLQHQALTTFKGHPSEQLVRVTGIRTHSDNIDQLDLLTHEDLYMFEVEHIAGIADRLKVGFEILLGLQLMHEKEYFLGNESLGKAVLLTEDNRVRLKPYAFTKYDGFQFGEAAKDKNRAQGGIELCFQFKKSCPALDIWKWAVLMAGMISDFSLQKYINSVFAWDMSSRFGYEIRADQDWVKREQVIAVLQRCLQPNPKERPEIADILLVFEPILASMQFPINATTLELSKQSYLALQANFRGQFKIQLTSQLVLTEELKKKLSLNFIKSGLKAPKAYRPLYSAKRFGFSPLIFWQQCHQQSRVLILIDALDAGIIAAYIDPEIAMIEGNGMAGGFIADPNVRSFIYSFKNQESYKILYKDKAFRAVPGKGPIIGDGDIALGSSPDCVCNFPRSFDPGKHKKLAPGPQFRIASYDAYALAF